MTFGSRGTMALVSAWLTMPLMAAGCFGRTALDSYGAPNQTAGVGAGQSSVAGQGTAGIGGSGTTAGDFAGAPDAGFGLPALRTNLIVDNEGTGAATVGSECGAHWWSVFRAGVSVDTGKDCMLACDDYDSMGAVGCPDACSSTRSLLVPGTQATFAWDGYERTYARQECFELVAPMVDENLTARACIDVGSDASDGACTERPFYYGETDVSVVVAPQEKVAMPTLMTIENNLSVSIEIVTNHCGFPGWFALSATEQNATLASFCPCACGDAFSNVGCPTCGECTEDEIATVAPGESYATTWAGYFFYNYPSGCSARYAMPKEYRPTFHICFRKMGDSSLHCFDRQSIGDLGHQQLFQLYEEF